MVSTDRPLQVDSGTNREVWREDQRGTHTCMRIIAKAIGGHLVSHGEITVGDLTSLLMYSA